MTVPSAAPRNPTTKRGWFVPGTTYITPTGITGGVRLLSDADKMPCKSWSLPAKFSCPGHLGRVKGSPCWYCYADKRGHYARKCVQRAQWERFVWTRESLKTAAGRDAWVAHLTAAIKAQRNDVFRGHDAGDMFSPEYADMWTRVAQNLPTITFWFPTQSHRIPHILPALRAFAALPNVTLRPSCAQVDGPPVHVAGLHAGTQVLTDRRHLAPGAYACPALTRTGADHGKCMDCRMCFFGKTIVVAYTKHTA